MNSGKSKQGTDSMRLKWGAHGCESEEQLACIFLPGLCEVVPF